MKRDSDLMHRIMDEFEVKSFYETHTPNEAYHVALLKDMHCVKAIVQHDQRGVYAYAKILMITERGYNVLDELRKCETDSLDCARSIEEQEVKNGATIFLSKYDLAIADEAYKIEVEETRLYETRMHLANFGGISAILLVCKGFLDVVANNAMPSPAIPFMQNVTCHPEKLLSAFKVVPIAILFWCLSEISLVVSHGLSAKAHNVFQSEIYAGNRATGWKSSWRTATLWANRSAGAFFSLGVIAAVMFLFVLTRDMNF